MKCIEDKLSSFFLTFSNVLANYIENAVMQYNPVVFPFGNAKQRISISLAWLMLHKDSLQNGDALLKHVLSSDQLNYLEANVDSKKELITWISDELYKLSDSNSLFELELLNEAFTTVVKHNCVDSDELTIAAYQKLSMAKVSTAFINGHDEAIPFCELIPTTHFAIGRSIDQIRANLVEPELLTRKTLNNVNEIMTLVKSIRQSQMREFIASTSVIEKAVNFNSKRSTDTVVIEFKSKNVDVSNPTRNKNIKKKRGPKVDILGHLLSA
jgi:hypothetical protein